MLPVNSTVNPVGTLVPPGRTDKVETEKKEGQENICRTN